MIIQLNNNVKLELLAAHHAAPLFDAVDKNREHLSRFLPWVGNMQSVEDLNQYIRHSQSLYEHKKEVSFVIFANDLLVGRIGLHHLNIYNKSAAIGYWLARAAQGKGIITNACKAIITYGFKALQLHRIEIKAATHNLKSRAIAEKLGFKKEGTLREAEWVNDRFLDLVVYAMLRYEWNDDSIND